MSAMARSRIALLWLVLGAAGVLVGWRVVRASGHGHAERGAAGPAASRSAAAPMPAFELRPLSVSYPPGFGRRRVILDPGHGAAGNSGNESCRCEPEQDYTLGLAQDLARQLEATGHFEVRLTREPGQLVAYAPRVAQAESWKAEAFLSLHSDVRGRPDAPGVGAGPVCPHANEEPGFAVLWSDQAAGALGAARSRLGHALGTRLREVGLWPYDGVGYRGLYDGDSAAPGVFVDRHEPGQRIFVLHAPSMASAIIETHNAWNELEASRWHEPATRQALGTALAAALVDALASSGP
jgi:N-acetylmuramoyl-L-alanine amidase